MYDAKSFNKVDYLYKRYLQLYEGRSDKMARPQIIVLHRAS